MGTGSGRLAACLFAWHRYNDNSTQYTFLIPVSLPLILFFLALVFVVLLLALSPQLPLPLRVCVCVTHLGSAELENRFHARRMQGGKSAKRKRKKKKKKPRKLSDNLDENATEASCAWCSHSSGVCSEVDQSAVGLLFSAVRAEGGWIILYSVSVTRQASLLCK